MYKNFIKWALDIVVSIIAILVFLPISVVIAVLIKLTMPGPIFFVQERVGLHGMPFKMIKFRTMRVEAGAEKGKFDAGNGSRITGLGKLLRKTKLDEIPQFINVLMGDMSIVGPRPEVQPLTEIHTERWKVVHSVRPGITDNASIAFRNEEELLAAAADPSAYYREVILPQKLDLYISYTRHQSFLNDAKIVIKTFYTVIFR
jgi:lipopolysaccharide/colanic/teichoic acid biosynthesis glycosyltransferase